MTCLGHPEGRFLPEIYHFSKGTSDLDILRRAYEAMERASDEGFPLGTPYKALILASIVGKEMGLASERPTIAGVFIRCLD